MAFNLEVLDVRKKANEGAFLHFKHPAKPSELLYDGETPVGLFMLGRDSDVFVQRTHKKNNEVLTQKQPQELTSEDMEQDGYELIADLTTGWQALAVDGSEIFTRERLIKMLKQYPWAFEQANLFAGTRANFI